MTTTKNPYHLPRILIMLTIMFVVGQFTLLYLHSKTSSLFDTFVSASMTREVLHLKIFIVGLLQFIAGQTVMYAAFIWLLWYIAISAGARLQPRTTYLCGIFLWFCAVITILAANAYYSRHSFFAQLTQNTIFGGNANIGHAFWTMLAGVSVIALGMFLTFLNLIRELLLKEHLLRHSLILFFMGCIAASVTIQRLNAEPTIYTATAKPNVILIGIDALRPDFVSYNSQHGAATPNLDAFLKDSTHFTDSMTTLARTFPSWSSILTSAYPLHNNVRGNNTDLSVINVSETLAKQFQKAGYETIYSTDDTRFNNTTQIFGFDHVLSPPMGLNDFLFATLNDFPLSNLLIPTQIGKWLFPYNYANHGTAQTYTPQSYLQLLADQLHARDDKPLFLAVHFTISHWPYYWYNDKQKINSPELQRYKVSVEAADEQFHQFMQILTANHLLGHTLVVLLSDHGITLGLPGDRPVSTNNYQGDKSNINKLSVVPYATTVDKVKNKNRLALDTSYGYGGDVLSIKQFKTLLTFRGFGIDIGKAHAVADRVSMLDIAPTILNLLNMPALTQSDGISLQPYFFNASGNSKKDRLFFLETTFSPGEIEREEISVDLVLQKALQFYQVDPATGLISIKAEAEKTLNLDKQYGVLQDNWLYVQYPPSRRMKFEDGNLKYYIFPAYEVLVNLQTDQWTTELNTPFAILSPAKFLKKELQNFYGNELNPIA